MKVEDLNNANNLLSVNPISDTVKIDLEILCSENKMNHEFGNLSNETFYDEYDDICNELIYANESTLTTS